MWKTSFYLNTISTNTWASPAKLRNNGDHMPDLSPIELTYTRLFQCSGGHWDQVLPYSVTLFPAVWHFCIFYVLEAIERFSDETVSNYNCHGNVCSLALFLLSWIPIFFLKTFTNKKNKTKKNNNIFLHGQRVVKKSFAR